MPKLKQYKPLHMDARDKRLSVMFGMIKLRAMSQMDFYPRFRFLYTKNLDEVFEPATPERIFGDWPDTDMGQDFDDVMELANVANDVRRTKRKLNFLKRKLSYSEADSL